jgi:hypothetical protein
LACGCKSVAATILAWHIATGLFELKDQEQPDSDSKIAATQLSRYCAYLVACHPELLQDQDDWCKKLYTEVLKDAHCVLCAAGKRAGFQQLHDLLQRAEQDDSNVLRNGARIAAKLAPINDGWERLADFWSEMILYIAPSENLDGHAEAIASGSEMLTLLWALLAHAGVVDRLDDSADGTTNNRPAEDAPVNAAGNHHV